MWKLHLSVYEALPLLYANSVSPAEIGTGRCGQRGIELQSGVPIVDPRESFGKCKGRRTSALLEQLRAYQRVHRVSLQRGHAEGPAEQDEPALREDLHRVEHGRCREPARCSVPRANLPRELVSAACQTTETSGFVVPDACGDGNNCAGAGAHRIARHARPRRCEKDSRASRAMSGYDRRSGRDGGRVSGFSDGYGARERGNPDSDRGAGRDEPRGSSRYDDRGRNDDGYGYGRGGDDHGRSPYPPPPDSRGPPAPSSGAGATGPTPASAIAPITDSTAAEVKPPTGTAPSRSARAATARPAAVDTIAPPADTIADTITSAVITSPTAAPRRDRPRDFQRRASSPSRGGAGGGGDGYGGGFDDRAPPSSYDRGRGRDAGYPPPPRRDASRDRAPDSGGNNRGGDNRQDELQMEVPAEVAKIVIGAGGNSIKDLQDRTGAHVMIYKPQPGARESGYRPVMIRGSARAVDLAADELRRVVRDYEDGVVGGKPKGGQGFSRGHDRGGFGDRYGGGYEREPARDRYDRYDRHDDRGPPPGSRSRDDRRGSFPPSFGGDDHVEERVECPIENRGIVIGKSGKQVQRIERDTGAKISSIGDEPFLLIAAPLPRFETPSPRSRPYSTPRTCRRFRRTPRRARRTRSRFTSSANTSAKSWATAA